MRSTENYRKMTGYVLSVVIGIISGIITLIGQMYLPVNLNFLSNSVSMWLVSAFLVPYCIKSDIKRSALLGTVVLIFCVLSYYIFEAVSNHHLYYINRYQLLWLSCALIGSPVIGLCADLSQTKGNFIGNICRNVLPAVFFTEALSKLFYIRDYTHMIPALCLQMGIGLVIYAMINRKHALKKENIIAFILLLIPGSIAFEILWRLTI